MPAKPNHTGASGVPSAKGIGAVRTFADGIVPYFPERNFVISGVTKDATGAPLGGVAVELFNTATDVREQAMVSDAGGNYAFTVDKTQFWYLSAYKSGAPDVAGSTVNTLVGL
jgi:hypothetical protein